MLRCRAGVFSRAVGGNSVWDGGGNQGDGHYSMFILLGNDVSMLEETCSKRIQVTMALVGRWRRERRRKRRQRCLCSELELCGASPSALLHELFKRSSFPA